jgi:CHAT domain-containing protein
LWDGDLTVEEVGRLQLGPATVVLSACQSGLGEIHPGDEIVGLPHAFFAAGARTVVVSHWHVDDESTVDVMVAYHEWLQVGLAPARALAEAQRAALRQGLTPYEWGGFVAMGAP